jgi:Ca2+-dependent lipid-binding protein
MGVLTVFLDKIDDLKDEDGIGRSDPYVKFELEQDNSLFDKDFGKQESSKKKGTCNPVYHETFTFANIPSLRNMVLTVRIKDEDVGFDDNIGYCKIELDGLDLSDKPRAIDKVIDRKGLVGRIFKKEARIHLQLSYKE